MIAAIGHVGIKAQDAVRTLPRRIRVLPSPFGAGDPIRPLGQPVSLRWFADPPFGHARTFGSGMPAHTRIACEGRCLGTKFGRIWRTDAPCPRSDVR